MLMVFIEFFRWWYAEGWITLVKKLAARLRNIWYVFSVPTLLRTLFAPWRRIVTYPAKGFGPMMRAMVDNLISRLIGFIVRVMVILAATVGFILTVVLGVIFVVLWPVAPLLIIGLIIRGVMP